METTTNISKPLFETVTVPKEQKLAEIRRDYTDTVIEKTVNEVDTMLDLSWYTLLAENSNSENDLDITEIIRLLTNSVEQHWYQPIDTLSLYLKLLALNIDEDFNTDVAFIEDIQDTVFFSHEQLREMYSELRTTKEKNGRIHKREDPQADTIFDSLFARYFYTEGQLYGKAVDMFRWRSKPKVSEYALFQCYLNQNKTVENVVAKVKEKRRKTLDLTQELSTTDSSRKSIITSYPIFECDVLSYHEDIPQEYPELQLQEANKRLILMPGSENMITLTEENPLPL